MPPSVTLHQRKFEDMIARRGRGVYWERAMRCSCFNDYSGNPLKSCKACDGAGFIYDDPLYEDAVLVMSLIVNKEYTPIGEYQLGDAVATIPFEKPVVDPLRKPPKYYAPVPMYWIGEHDRVTLMTSEFIGTQALCHKKWYRGEAPDTIKTPHVIEIVRVIQSNPDTGEVKKYAENVDFRQDGNEIAWIDGGDAPEDGTYYTAMFKYHPMYTVYTSLPQPRDQDGQRFPRKVVLRYNGVI